MQQLEMRDRLLLAAIVDRLIYASGAEFNFTDAIDALRLVPSAQRRSWFGLKAAGSAGTRRSQGYAIGVGSVRLKEDHGFSYDTDRGIGVRAGQWKLIRQRGRAGRESLEIEQVAASETDAGRCARVDYVSGAPTRMMLLVGKSLSIPVGWSPKSGVYWVEIGYHAYAPWKRVENGPPSRRDPYSAGPMNGRSGLSFVAVR